MGKPTSENLLLGPLPRPLPQPTTATCGLLLEGGEVCGSPAVAVDIVVPRFGKHLATVNLCAGCLDLWLVHGPRPVAARRLAKEFGLDAGQQPAG